MWCPLCRTNHHFETNSDCPLSSPPPKENFSCNKKNLSKNSPFLFTIPSHYKSVAHRQKLYKITEAAIAAQQKISETLEAKRMRKCAHNENWTWCTNCNPYLNRRSGNDGRKHAIDNLREEMQQKFNMAENAKQKYSKNDESISISSHCATLESGKKDCEAKIAGKSIVQDCGSGFSGGKNAANITDLTKIKDSESSEKQNVSNMACFAAKKILSDNTCENKNKNMLNISNDSNSKSGVILNTKEKVRVNTTAIPGQLKKSLSSVNYQVRFPQLSAGSISKILEGQEVMGAVVQILGYEKLPGSKKTNYLLFISDGVSSIDSSTEHLFTCMDRKFNSLVTNNELKEFTIIQINKYICYYVQPVCKVIILLDFDVLVPGAEIRKKVGIPIISSALTVSSTENNAELNSILNGLVRSIRPQVHITPRVLRPPQDHRSVQGANKKYSKNNEIGKEKRDRVSVFSQKRFHSDMTDMESKKIFKTSDTSYPERTVSKSKGSDSGSSEGKNTANITRLTEIKDSQSSKKQNVSDNTCEKTKLKNVKIIGENKNESKLIVSNYKNSKSDATLNMKEKMAVNTTTTPGQIKRSPSSKNIQNAVKEYANNDEMGKRLRDDESFFPKKRFCPDMTRMASNKNSTMSVTSHPGKLESESKTKDSNSGSSEGKNTANITGLTETKDSEFKKRFCLDMTRMASNKNSKMSITSHPGKLESKSKTKDSNSGSSEGKNTANITGLTETKDSESSKKRNVSDNTCEKIKSNDKIISEKNNSRLNVSNDDNSKSDVTLKTKERMTIAFPGPRVESLLNIKSHFESQKPHEIHKVISSSMKQTVIDVPTSKGIQDHNYTQIPWMLKYPEVSDSDLKCLNEPCSSHEPDKSDKEKYLNDTIIEFYMKYICNKLTPDQKQKTYILSSYFFPKLEQEQKFLEETGRAPERSIEKTWLKNADMFSKDFILIPINESLHWYLIVICYLSKLPKIPLDGSKTTTTDETKKDDTIDKTKRPCICFFDSARDILWDEKLKKTETLKKFLMRLCLSKQGDYTYDFNQLIPRNIRCPKQEDKFSCGIFLLQFAENFFQKSIDWGVENRPSACHWFSSAKIASERKRIKKIIQEIVEKKRKLTLSYSSRR